VSTDGTTRTPSSDDAIITYQTLRIGMVAMVAMLAAAVLTESARRGWHFESSISAYWYTPVRPVFVAVLVSIGVALIVVKGTDAWDDTWLNFAGVFAPVVAFVPTLLPGQANITDPAVLTQIANSMTALLVTGGGGIAVAAILRRREHLAPEGRPERWRVWGTIAIYVTGLVLFVSFRGTFTGRAHGIAAGLMFLSIAAAVFHTAFRSELRDTRLRPTYIALSLVMTVTLVIAVVVSWGGTSWFHFVLFVEVIEIAAFVTFWILQTREHWHETVRAAADQRAPAGDDASI
jgi:hypothetical protein